MYYTRLSVSCKPEFSEILMAEVAEAGFDSFIETERGFEAYVELEKFEKDRLHELETRYSDAQLTFILDEIPRENWNAQWEESYEPIIVEDRCLIRAAFHKISRKYPYEMIITPKMSFGTGHHQTTYLMVKAQMSIDHKGKRVMDAGCGTAILSIMASKLGAAEVEAFDIDEWSMINGKENAEVNQCANIRLQQGKIDEVQLEGHFDIVLANINKNVLLTEIEKYAGFLKSTGFLLISGFYTHDIADLTSAAEAHGLREVTRDERETWASVLLVKR